MSKHTLTTPERLTKGQERKLDCILETLSRYLITSEGEETLAGLEKVFGRITAGIKLQPVLTDREEKALRFIRRELKDGHSPSVREVGRILKLRSSRSAFKVIQNLILKQRIRRNGQLLSIMDLQ